MNNDDNNIRIFFPNNNLLIPLLQDSDNVVTNIFNAIFDNYLDNDRFNEAVQNSLDTYNEELFKKKNEFRINAKPIIYDLIVEKKCLICLNNLNNWIYKLPCQHMFHVDCLDNAVAHQHYKCCICNQTFPLQKQMNWQQQFENDDGHTIILSGNQDTI